MIVLIVELFERLIFAFCTIFAVIILIIILINVDASISPVGPSIGNEMLFIPTEKVNVDGDNDDDEDEDEEIGGSIVAFGLK